MRAAGEGCPRLKDFMGISHLPTQGVALRFLLKVFVAPSPRARWHQEGASLGIFWRLRGFCQPLSGSPAFPSLPRLLWPWCLQPWPFFFSSLKCEPQSHYRQTGCSTPTHRGFRREAWVEPHPAGSGGSHLLWTWCGRAGCREGHHRQGSISHSLSIR